MLTEKILCFKNGRIEEAENIDKDVGMDGPYFSSKSTEDFLKKNYLGHLIRAHRCGPRGYDLLHNGLAITIATTPHFEENAVGSYVVIENGKLCISTYAPMEFPPHPKFQKGRFTTSI
jgi:hypothetical protein